MQPTDDLKRQVKLGAMSFAKVLRALTDGPSSAQELQDATGLSLETLHNLMRALRKEKLAHIGSWEKDALGRDTIRIYRLGAGQDAPRRKKTKAQIARECRQRKLEQKMRAAFQPAALSAVTAALDASLVHEGAPPHSPPARETEGAPRGGYWRHAAVAKAA